MILSLQAAVILSARQLKDRLVTAEWITSESGNAPLRVIDLGNNPGLASELADWDVADALPELEYLNISGSSLTGTLCTRRAADVFKVFIISGAMI